MTEKKSSKLGRPATYLPEAPKSRRIRSQRTWKKSAKALTGLAGAGTTGAAAAAGWAPPTSAAPPAWVEASAMAAVSADSRLDLIQSAICETRRRETSSMTPRPKLATRPATV